MGFNEQGTRKPFFFFQLADTQLGMESSFTKKPGWKTELELMKRAVEEINRLKPAFVIICGDLIDEWPSDEKGRTADEQRRAEQERDFKYAASLIDAEIPLMCLCGNHDIGNRPNSITVRKYTESFGDDYFSFWCHGTKCLVLNSQLWKDDTDAQDLRAGMDAWLATELQPKEGGSSHASEAASSNSTESSDTDRGTCDRMLAFSHIAPFLHDPSEPDGYFNLPIELRQNLLAQMASAGVVSWFCGHYHRNAQGCYCHSSGRKLEVVTTGAVGTQIVSKEGGDVRGLSGIGGHKIGEDVSGLRVVNVLHDRVEHDWWTLQELREAKPDTVLLRKQ
eukprot:TRINITY_DN32878_c0_g1_i1.p1 TRINITY_DN32878_c0_g1~~TRINITY_DN32878_c0_g1_i1.p1  ORF type:complete len:387 (-),score=37.53 TRINITY_DN32878_c0_g1_i1:199-1203(-)